MAVKLTLRARSPNYPSIDLGGAIEAAAKISQKIHNHAAPRDVVLSSMGYKSYNGASAGVLSALLKYGLLVKVGEDFQLTPRWKVIQAPFHEREKSAAIQDALKSPSLWSELLDQFGGKLPDDSLIRATLLRKNFNPSAVSPVIGAFRESVEFAARFASGYGEPDEEKTGEAPMQTEINSEVGHALAVDMPTPQASSEQVVGHTEGDREFLHGRLSRNLSYRLVFKGEAGPKEIGKLIKVLELQKSLLEDDEDEAAC